MRQMKARIFTVPQFYHVIRLAMRSMPVMRKAEKSGLISKEFITRIMLVVTEVNGCAVCNYYHAKHALESGMSEEEITSMVNLEEGAAAEEEAVALLFAQHYADTFGNYEAEVWDRVLSRYGEGTAAAILAAIRVIMFGNINGIAFIALMNRLKGKGAAGRRIGSDLIQSLGIIFLIPAALIQNLFSRP